MTAPITASMLYDLVQCPRRVSMDLFGDPARRDPENPFVNLLWEKGHTFEKETVEKLQAPFTDLHDFTDAERQRLAHCLPPAAR